MSDKRAALCGVKDIQRIRRVNAKKVPPSGRLQGIKVWFVQDDFILVRIVQPGRQTAWRAFRRMAGESIFYGSIPARNRRVHPSHRAEASPPRSAGIRLWMP